MKGKQLLNLEDIREGMLVYVIPKSPYDTRTHNTAGWNDDMDEYIGTIQRVKEKTESYVIFYKGEFFWHPGDLDLPPSIEGDVVLKGKETTFDVNELVV